MEPKIIAHRGASAHAPENTIAAFQLALEQGADGIELDVMLSKDDQLVVIHDATVDRTTNGTGKVRDLTLDELKKLDAGNGEKIPTLTEVFDHFGGKFLINIELKNYASPFDRLPIEVARAVARYDLVDSVLISSFNPFNFSRFRRQVPEAVIGLLTLPGKAKSWLYRLFRYTAIHPCYEDADADLIAAAKVKNQQINVWTVDDPDEIRRLTDSGVDGIITNDPRLAMESLE